MTNEVIALMHVNETEVGIIISILGIILAANDIS